MQSLYIFRCGEEHMAGNENVTYMLRCSDGTLYTGWTNNMEKRLKAHNAGKGGKYTRVRIPVELVYQEGFESRQEAMSREAQIKQLTRRQKEALIAGKFGQRREQDQMYHVLLADDEEWEMTEIKNLIEHSGLPLQVAGKAENGIAALKAVEEMGPDILIADVKMPGLDGLELAEKIKERNLPVKIILLSGHAEYEYARSAVRHGVQDYLFKPVGQEGLNQVLEKIIQEKRDDGRKKEAAPERAPEGVLKQVLDEIGRAYMEDLTLSGLAEKYNISASRLSVRMKEKLGMPFSKYLTAMRVEKAKELLEDDRLSVEQIAELVGYRDYFYFTKVFKKASGVSPSGYRKGLAQEDGE